MSTQSNKQSSNPTGAALYLRWLGILCAVMAAFCLGVFIIGYKDPSFGRIATFIALAIASPEYVEPDGAFYLWVRALEEDAAAFSERAKQFRRPRRQSRGRARR